MSTYMNKVVGNLVQTRTGFTTKERTTARQNIDLNASLFTSSDNSLNFEDLDNDTKQINVTSDAYSLTSNAGINIVPNDTDKTIAINHATTTAADAEIVRVGNDAYGHVVLGTAITAADFKAVTYTDAQKTTDSDKYIYLLNGVATEGQTVLDVNSTNSGLTLEDSKFIKINCGTNLAIGTDGKLNNTYTYTLPEATTDNLGGIKIGYKSSSDEKNYAVQLDSNNHAYVNVPWSDTNTHIYFGIKNASANSKQENGNVYMTLTDESTVRHSYNITGSGGTTVTSDANGNITINSVKPDNRTIAIDNYSEIALAMGGIEFQGSIPSNTYRYAKVCTLTKTRKLTGGSVNLNASFLVTYSGTDNTNPSLINISARIQGSTSSEATDAQKYGINKFNFTETRSNPTNKGITLYAQAYVTDNLQLVIDIYAKTSENWHGIKLTQLHAGGTYSIKYSDGTGAYDIKYYGPDSPNTAPLIETETEPEKPSNVYSSEDDFFRAKNCVNIDYFSLGTWDADDTALYMHVYYQSSGWRDYHGSTITDSTVKDRIYNMTTTYLDIGEKTSTPSALVLRSLDELGRASVKTILYSSTNYITSYENQIIRLQLPSENGATLATETYAYRLYRNAYNLAATRRSASVSKVITEATYDYAPTSNPIYQWKETIKIGNKSSDGKYDLNLRLVTQLVVPNDPKTSYIALSRLDVLPNTSKWGKLSSRTTFDVFGISHGYVIKTATQYNIPYTTTVLDNPAAVYDNTICDRILAPSSLIDDDDPIIATPSYTELYIRAYNESLGGLISVRLTLYLRCVSRKGTNGGFNLELGYAYDILDYPILE